MAAADPGVAMYAIHAHRPLRDVCVLLLEDDALISLDAEDMLRALGARRVVVAHTLESAAAAVGREPIDAAVLDILIGHGRSDGLARLLLALGLPVVFATGYSDAAVPDDLRHLPKVVKPYSGAGLSAALAAAGVRSARPE
jgi:DNA-binding NtrC family response regulator